ncbi:MAG TPA: DoxX family protein [Candidatus Acidoferrum sp.]|nr:DoxX family protein [Candidatus Acidoferrum sp.]
MIHDLGLLAARLAFGLSFASYGTQKAFGWFDGLGPQGTAKVFEGYGHKPGERFVAPAAATEIGAGLAIALGLGGPAGPAGAISQMFIAQAAHAKNGYYASKHGVELSVLYASGALALASSGYGKLSLDRAFGLDEKLHKPAFTALAVAGGLAAAWLILAQRDLTPPDGTMATPTIAGSRNGAVSSTPQPATN